MWVTIVQKFMNNLWIGITVVSVVTVLLITTIICIVVLIKFAKSKRDFIAKEQLLSAVGPIMAIAEKYKNYSGAEKREYVLTKINQLAIENKIKYDVRMVSDKIEELIKLTKEIN